MTNKYRTDENHAEVRDGLRKAGYEVIDRSMVKHGVPDLEVRDKGRNPRWYFVEVKMPGEVLTDDEREFMERHPSDTYVVHGLDEALQLLLWLDAEVLYDND